MATIAFMMALGISQYRNERKLQSVTQEVFLHTGIRDIVRLGDTETQFVNRAKRYKPEKLEVRQTASTGKPEDRMQFNTIYQLADIGVRIYFRTTRVSLIEMQEPFRGTIQGRRLTLFSFAPPPGTTWEDYLMREFGTPQARASGGKFGSEAMFYFWGDISFNRMGPNQLAIYHDSEISSWRQNNFGRDVRFFK